MPRTLLSPIGLCMNPDLKDFKDGRNVWGGLGCMTPQRLDAFDASPFCWRKKGRGGMVHAHALGACGYGRAGSNPASPPRGMQRSPDVTASSVA